RVARPQMQIGQDAAPPPAAPLRRQDHQVQRFRELYLEPAGAPPPCLVWGVRRLCHDSFVAPRKHVLIEGPRLLCIRCHQGWRHIGQNLLEYASTLERGQVDKGNAVLEKTIEKED